MECVGKEPTKSNYEHALLMNILYEHDIISGPLSKSLEGSCANIAYKKKMKEGARTKNPLHLLGLERSNGSHRGENHFHLGEKVAKRSSYN